MKAQVKQGKRHRRFHRWMKILGNQSPQDKLGMLMLCRSPVLFGNDPMAAWLVVDDRFVSVRRIFVPALAVVDERRLTPTLKVRIVQYVDSRQKDEPPNKDGSELKFPSRQRRHTIVRKSVVVARPPLMVRSMKNPRAYRPFAVYFRLKAD